MSIRRRSLLTALFLGFAAFGARVIFLPELISGETAIFIPLAMVAAYGLLCAALTAGGRKDEGGEAAEHFIDSIYFLGFLYTLFSLAALFYRLSSEDLFGTEGGIVMTVLYYVGVSVTTSIAGVLLRTVLRGILISETRSEADEAAKTYELLQSIAHEFSARSKDSFEAMRLFLEERSVRITLLEEREKAYIKNLDSLSETSRRFSEGLSNAEGELIRGLGDYTTALLRQREQVEEIGRISGDLAACSERLVRETREMPLQEINRELKDFENGTRELNTVVDSLVSLLERKVEKVR